MTSSSTSSLSSVSSNASNYLKPKVALIGSGGMLGEATLQAFLSSEFFDFFAKPIRVLTRDIRKVPPGNVSYVRIYWDEDDIDEQLTRALRGVSVVVNLLGYNPEAWYAVTRAVCKLKPQLYFPPEFSFDHTLWDARRIPIGSIVYDKRQQAEAARAAGVLTVQLFCGIITENILPVNPAAGLEYTKPGRLLTAVTSDNGTEASISFTSCYDVARSIAYISSLPALPATKFHISGDVGSWSKLARLTGAELQLVSAASFEAREVNIDSPLETFLRIAAANGDLHFPASSRRRATILNENYLVDPTATHRWIKLSTVVRGFDKHDNDGTQPSTSSPEDSIRDTKRKRGDSDSASEKSDHADGKLGQVALEAEQEEQTGRNILHHLQGWHDRSEDSTLRPMPDETAVESAEKGAKKAPATDTRPATLKPKVKAQARITATPRSSSSVSARAGAGKGTRPPETATTQQAPAAVWEKRVTRSMTKRQTQNEEPHTTTTTTPRPRSRLNHISRGITTAATTPVAETDIKNDGRAAASFKRKRIRLS